MEVSNFKWKKKIGDTHATAKGHSSGTLCGIPMLGNNYADQAGDVTCSKCLTLLSENYV